VIAPPPRRHLQYSAREWAAQRAGEKKEFSLTRPPVSITIDVCRCYISTNRASTERFSAAVDFGDLAAISKRVKLTETWDDIRE
jgi:hypothetical protein